MKNRFKHLIPVLVAGIIAVSASPGWAASMQGTPPVGATGPAGPAGITLEDFSEITSSGAILARRWNNGSGDPVMIEVYPEATAKPDEGDAAVSGTLAHSIAIFDTAGTGGKILWHGYGGTISTTIRNDVEGLAIECSGTWRTIADEPHFRAGSAFNSTMIELGFDTALIRRPSLKGCHLDGNKANNTAVTGVHISAAMDALVEDVAFTSFDGPAIILDGHATISGNVESKILRNFFDKNDDIQIKVISNTSIPSDWHIYENMLAGGSGATVTLPSVQIASMNGGTFQNNHIYSTRHEECFEDIDTGQADAHLISNIFESCSTHGFVISSDHNLIESTKVYALGGTDTSDALRLLGNDNTVVGFNVSEVSSNTRNGVSVLGDNNSLASIQCANINGSCVDIQSTADGTIIGQVKADSIEGAVILNAGSATVVRGTASPPVLIEDYEAGGGDTAYWSNVSSCVQSATVANGGTNSLKCTGAQVQDRTVNNQMEICKLDFFVYWDSTDTSIANEKTRIAACFNIGTNDGASVFLIKNGSNAPFISAVLGTSTSVTDQAITQDAWHRVEFIVDQFTGRYSFYVDSALVEEGAAQVSDAIERIQIGNNGFNAANFITYFDDTRVYHSYPADRFY